MSQTSEAAASHCQHKRIVIVGNGLAAWLTAYSLANAVNSDEYSICVVAGPDKADSMSPFVYADATLPPAHQFLQESGLDEDKIIANTGGSFSHGIALSGWTSQGTSYFHPYGSAGAALGPVSFHQLALRLRHAGIPVRLANFSLAALAAQAGRLVPAGSDPRSILATCQQGLHLDCNMLSGILSTQARAMGVMLENGGFRYAERSPGDTLLAVITSDDNRIEGDLFVDCSGVDGVLAEPSDSNDWQDWSDWLPCNSLVSGIVDTRQAPPPYSHAEAFDSGWIRHLPMQSRTVLNGLYRADAGTEEQVLNRLLDASGSREIQPIYAGPVRFGRRKKAWQGNTVALGTATAVIDPLAITNLQLLMSGIQRLLQLLPGNGNVTALATEYNRQTALYLDRARDFAILHYKLNGRHGEPFWDACRAMSVPQTLAYKLQLFESRGRIPMYDEETVEESSWLNLLDEHGVAPRGYSRVAEGFGDADLHKHLKRVRSVMLETLQTIPLHENHLADLNSRLLAQQAKTS